MRESESESECVNVSESGWLGSNGSPTDLLPEIFRRISCNTLYLHTTRRKISTSFFQVGHFVRQHFYRLSPKPDGKFLVEIIRRKNNFLCKTHLISSDE